MSTESVVGSKGGMLLLLHQQLDQYGADGDEFITTQL